MNIHIDSTIFLGMHHTDDRIRIAAKNFFVEHFDEQMSMALEEVGRCDDVIWQYPRLLQDAYYPFMDRLHTLMHIERFVYDEQDIHRALSISGDVSISKKLVLASVQARQGILHTFDTSAFETALNTGVAIVSTTDQTEKSFPPELEQYYQQSLVLRTV